MLPLRADTAEMLQHAQSATPERTLSGRGWMHLATLGITSSLTAATGHSSALYARLSMRCKHTWYVTPDSACSSLMLAAAHCPASITSARAAPPSCTKRSSHWLYDQRRLPNLYALRARPHARLSEVCAVCACSRASAI